MFARNNVTVTSIQSEDFVCISDDDASDCTRIPSDNDNISVSSAYFNIVEQPLVNDDSSCQLIMNDIKQVIIINDSSSVGLPIENVEAESSNHRTSQPTKNLEKTKKRKKFYKPENQVVERSTPRGTKFSDLNQRKKTRKAPLVEDGLESSTDDTTTSSDSEDQIKLRKKTNKHNHRKINSISDSDESDSWLTKNKSQRSKCEICDKTCSDLKEHIKRKHNKRNFKCDVCGNTFIQKGHLTTHIKFKHANRFASKK